MNKIEHVKRIRKEFAILLEFLLPGFKIEVQR